MFKSRLGAGVVVSGAAEDPTKSWTGFVVADSSLGDAAVVGTGSTGTIEPVDETAASVETVESEISDLDTDLSGAGVDSSFSSIVGS